MLRYSLASAFTRHPMEGNPVAVFHDAASLSGETMQAVARQLQLSETTFLGVPDRTDEQDVWRVRIFTPVNELPFAGHPLIGTAGVIARLTGREHFNLETQLGQVAVRVDRRGERLADVTIEVPPAKPEPFSETPALLASLGVDRTVLPVELYDAGARHVLVALESIDQLRALRPDHRALDAFKNMAINCFAIEGNRVENRMFSPAYGVVEDAGTGSVVAPIAQHLMRYGSLRPGETLRIEQGVLLKRRCIMLGRIRMEGDLVSLVELSGACTLLADGRMYLDPASDDAADPDGEAAI